MLRDLSVSIQLQLDVTGGSLSLRLQALCTVEEALVSARAAARWATGHGGIDC
eukprot:COSAG01_NODE_17777_length_1124_cov_70.393171_2_plen_52_part_01